MVTRTFAIDAQPHERLVSTSRLASSRVPRSLRDDAFELRRRPLELRRGVAKLRLFLLQLGAFPRELELHRLRGANRGQLRRVRRHPQRLCPIVVRQRRGGLGDAADALTAAPTVFSIASTRSVSVAMAARRIRSRTRRRAPKRQTATPPVDESVPESPRSRHLPRPARRTLGDARVHPREDPSRRRNRRTPPPPPPRRPNPHPSPSPSRPRPRLHLRARVRRARRRNSIHSRRSRRGLEPTLAFDLRRHSHPRGRVLVWNRAGERDVLRRRAKRHRRERRGDDIEGQNFGFGFGFGFWRRSFTSSARARRLVATVRRSALRGRHLVRVSLGADRRIPPRRLHRARRAPRRRVLLERSRGAM